MICCYLMLDINVLELHFSMFHPLEAFGNLTLTRLSKWNGGVSKTIANNGADSPWLS